MSCVSIRPWKLAIHSFAQCGVGHAAHSSTDTIDESSLRIGESRGVTGGQFSWSNQELVPMKAVELWAHRADDPCVKILWKQRGMRGEQDVQPVRKMQAYGASVSPLCSHERGCMQRHPRWIQMQSWSTSSFFCLVRGRAGTNSTDRS